MKKTLPFLLLALTSFLAYLFYRPPAEEPLQIEAVRFQDLPGWQQPSLQPSFAALQRSCALFLRRNPERLAGTPLIPLKISDWLPACQAAKSVDAHDNGALRQYFSQWFTPYVIKDKKPVAGLFTGYYALQLHGSREPSAQYPVPLYALPQDLAILRLQDFDKSLPARKIVARVEGHQLKPYPTRAAIVEGALADKASPIAWIASPVDRLFLEIQGSGRIRLSDGHSIWLGYAGENGAAYTAIAKVLIDKGVMTRDNASMQRIKRYLEAHPDEQDAILNTNESFVFFREQAQEGTLGAQGVVLTDGYSMAVDLRYIPLGIPLWLSTHYTDVDKIDKPLQRLMIAQDTGGAIRGPVRGDVYWGDDARAGEIAGRMKHGGQYWVLLPNAFQQRLQENTSHRGF
ncbi:MAG: MltA domain-containing protein [Legionellaceae bacterium]|nr:MltA domain-containing protein [Legionellaceae bacterium]